jgi:hypothetical protein
MTGTDFFCKQAALRCASKCYGFLKKNQSRSYLNHLVHNVSVSEILTIWGWTCIIKDFHAAWKVCDVSSLLPERLKICRSIPDRCNICHYFKVTKWTLGPTKSPIRYVPGAVSGRDLKFTSPSAKVKNEWRYTATTLGPHEVYAIKLNWYIFTARLIKIYWNFLLYPLIQIYIAVTHFSILITKYIVQKKKSKGIWVFTD